MRGSLILLVPLLALFAFVTTTVERAEGADVAPLDEGENFDVKPTGTSIVNASINQNDQALTFLSVFRGV